MKQYTILIVKNKPKAWFLRIFIGFFILFIASSLTSQPRLPTGKTITLKYEDKSYVIGTQTLYDFMHFSLQDIQRAFGFNVSVDTTTKRYTLTYQDKEVVLIPDNPWLKVGSRLINLPLAPRFKDGRLWLPLPVLNEVLEEFINRNAKVRQKKLVLFQPSMQIKKIVIDPGHGGKDPGGIGTKGLREKDIVLEVGKLVAEMLESELDVECIMTRDKDVFIPLGERTKMANDVGADLFVSIHCNAARSRKSHGCEVYFLSPAKTTWARAVEARENASLKFEVSEWDEELESILWDMAQAEFLSESNQLAGYLTNYICDEAHIKNRGVVQARFYVLHKVYMPAVLVELEFLSNIKGELNLRSKNFKRQLARGVVKGIAEFKDWYEERLAY